MSFSTKEMHKINLHITRFVEVGSNFWIALVVINSHSLVLLRHKYPGPQYPKRRLFVRSREVSKPRDLYLKLSDRSEIWQALRQHCCRCACQISKRYDNLKYQSRGFETSRDLTKRRLIAPSCLVLSSTLQTSSWSNNAEGLLILVWRCLFPYLL